MIIEFSLEDRLASANRYIQHIRETSDSVAELSGLPQALTMETLNIYPPNVAHQVLDKFSLRFQLTCEMFVLYKQYMKWVNTQEEVDRLYLSFLTRRHPEKLRKLILGDLVNMSKFARWANK